MRSPLLLSVLTLITACGSAGSTTAPASSGAPAPTLVPSPGRTSGAPTRFEVYAALTAAGGMPLAEGEHCQDVVGGRLQRAPTLGDWVAWNLAVVDEVDEEGAITLPVECRAAEGRPGEWECTALFQAGQGGESPWSWGVRVRLRDADGAIVPGSLACLGAG